MSSASKIWSELLSKGTDIIQRIVNWRLMYEFGLKAHRPALKPKLIQAMKDKRLTFVQKHTKWTVQQWQQVLFANKSTVQQLTTRKRFVR